MREYKVIYRDIDKGNEFYGIYVGMTGKNSEAFVFIGTRENKGVKLIVGTKDIVDIIKL